MRALLLTLFLTGCASFDHPDDKAVASMWKQAHARQQFDRCPQMPAMSACHDTPLFVFSDAPHDECAALGVSHRLVIDAGGELRQANKTHACYFSRPVRMVILPWAPGKLLVQHELAHDRHGAWHA